MIEVDTNATKSTVEEFKYNLQNQLIEYKSNVTSASYTYGTNGLRKSKQVTGSQNKDFVWDGMNLVEEIRGGVTSEKYTYGVDGITTRTESDGYVTVYNKNAHGDVVGLWYAQDNDTTKYVYDAFGNQLAADMDSNPFRYCGEYYDSESGNIYLRARYYDSSNGRFINEDPIKDGLNWYIYCGGNPVGFVDPLGLFDYNDRLSYSQSYNQDVEVLQNELVWLGYLDMDDNDSGWGYFGPKTQNAVNRYKDDKGLGNTGDDYGVVGLQTWTSLGLIYRTQADIDAGVKIVMIGGRKQYKDVSVPINKALNKAEGTFAAHAGDVRWFMNQVNHEAEWDIKRKTSWEKTIGSTFPGSYDTTVVLYEGFTTPEQLGNITYGYLGAAARFSESMLIAGSMYAAGSKIITDKNARANEFKDHDAIKLGYDWWQNRYGRR